MRKQTIQYTSPIDALIAVTKRLSIYESQQEMDSEEFFDQYTRGQLSDDAVFIDWANDYRHYLQLRQKLIERLSDVAWGFGQLSEDGRTDNSRMPSRLR